jgi:hypothetical protein
LETRTAAAAFYRGFVDSMRARIGPMPSWKTLKVFAIGVALGVSSAYVVASALRLDFGARPAPATQDRRDAIPSAGPTAAP